LHALASRPDRALYLCGASFAAEAEWMAARGGMMQAAVQLGVTNGRVQRIDHAVMTQALLNRLSVALDAIANRYGAEGVRQVASGVAIASSLTTCAKNNLRDQLGWLSSIERYKVLAQRISARIERECPDIDRETFVEPREMCSTTHVHDDHRLVVIESGTMVLWGNLGMTVRLVPGEMVFVPQGRLHGSSIDSDSCRYHQPIIPDAWIESLLSEPESASS
jgi:mannose-6-phosphate isomerase-like protein (cupin superfamily)